MQPSRPIRPARCCFRRSASPPSPRRRSPGTTSGDGGAGRRTNAVHRHHLGTALGRDGPRLESVASPIACQEQRLRGRTRRSVQAWLSHKSAATPVCCRSLQRPADRSSSPTWNRLTGKAVGVTSASLLGISPTPSTHARPQTDRRSNGDARGLATSRAGRDDGCPDARREVSSGGRILRTVARPGDFAPRCHAMG